MQRRARNPAPDTLATLASSTKDLLARAGAATALREHHRDLRKDAAVHAPIASRS